MSFMLNVDDDCRSKFNRKPYVNCQLARKFLKDMENKFVSSKELEEARLKRQEEWKKAFERIGESIVHL